MPEEIVTERLIMRVPMPGDGRAVNEAIQESLGDLGPWMPWATPPPTVEESEINSRRARARFILREDVPFWLFLRSTGQYVGGAGLLHIDWAVPRFEVGYWCRTSLQGCGYVTEAVRGITRLAFDKLGAQRMEIRCDSRNTQSRRVAERCLYSLEATLRNNGRSLDGTLRDTLVFALTPDGYEERYG